MGFSVNVAEFVSALRRLSDDALSRLKDAVSDQKQIIDELLTMAAAEPKHLICRCGKRLDTIESDIRLERPISTTGGKVVGPRGFAVKPRHHATIHPQNRLIREQVDAGEALDYLLSRWRWQCKRCEEITRIDGDDLDRLFLSTAHHEIVVGRDV